MGSALWDRYEISLHYYWNTCRHHDNLSFAKIPLTLRHEFALTFDSKHIDLLLIPCPNLSYYLLLKEVNGRECS